MSEPRLEDDIALDLNETCEDCAEPRDECECGEPDVMWSDYYGDD